MTEINLYIGMKKSGLWRYGYILEAIIRGEAVTRSGSGETAGGIRKALLTAITEALQRITRTCSITVWIPEGTHMMGTLVSIPELAGQQYYEGMRKVPNHKQLQEIHDSGHSITWKEGESPYTNWINRNLLEEEGEKSV